MISPMIGYKVKKNWIKDRNLFILKGRWVSFSLIMCVMMLSFVACHEDQAEEESSWNGMTRTSWILSDCLTNCPYARMWML